jgi:hypothetical protein
MYLGKYLTDFDEKWTYLELRTFLTLTFLDFFDRVIFNAIMHPLKYDNRRDNSVLRL